MSLAVRDEVGGFQVPGICGQDRWRDDDGDFSPILSRIRELRSLRFGMLLLIIYRGKGKRIIGFALLGALTGLLLDLAIPGLTEHARKMAILPGIAWGMTAGIWYAVKHLNDRSITSGLDASTQQRVLVPTKHDLFFMPPLVWALLSSAGAIGITMLVFLASTIKEPRTIASKPIDNSAAVLQTPSDSSTASGVEERKDADSTPNIESPSFNDVKALLQRATEPETLGSSKGAQAVAKAILESGKVMLQTDPKLAQATKSLARSRAFCQLRDDTSAMIVHISEDEWSNADQRDAIARVLVFGWATQSHAFKSKLRQFAVGILSESNQLDVRIGNVSTAPNEPPHMERAIRGTLAHTAMEPFFGPAKTRVIEPKGSVRIPDEALAEKYMKSAALFRDPNPDSPSNSARVPSPSSLATSKVSVDITSSTREQPFVNSLGMKFVPVPGTRVLFCIHETRKRDYAVFAATNPKINNSWTTRSNSRGLVNFGDDYPVAFISWSDARAFCEWLSSKETRTYRLPSDHEWSCAVGLTSEDAGDLPSAKSGKSPNIYPWGTDMPPNKRVGNLADETARSHTDWTIIAGYNDGFEFSAPVMSFTPNALGLHDMSGNVAEWCDSNWSALEKVERGGSYATGSKRGSSSDHRGHHRPDEQWTALGFRIVVELDR